MSRRDRQLAAIHVGRKQLGLDEAAYRGLLRRVTGRGSLREMDRRERGRVLDALRRLGFEPAQTGVRRRLEAGSTTARGRNVAHIHDAHVAKVRALWLSAANLGVIERADEPGLRGFVKRQTGRDDLRWCGPAEINAVVEGLKAWLSRDGGVVWTGEAGEAVLRAQWRRLEALGRPPAASLGAWRRAQGLAPRGARVRAQIALGALIRTAEPPCA